MSSDFDAQFDAAFEGLPADPDDAVSEGAENTAAPLDYSQYTDTPEGFRSGFVSFVGRPNTGKSTLTNALVGQKIAITADQPETTRHTIRGLVHREDAQVIVVDTPGLHRPRTLLGERLNEVVKDTYADVDVIGLTIPADEKIGPGDRWILENVRSIAPKTPIIGIVTKLDKASKDQVGAQLLALHELLSQDDPNAVVIPVSSKEGVQLDELVQVIVDHLPEGPKFYPDDHITDEGQEKRIEELIREAALSGLKAELPHSVAVQVDEMLPSRTREGVLDIHAILYLERPGQKRIIEGKDGLRFRRIVGNARKEIIELLGHNVYLDLRIKVLKNWQSDPKSLGRLGF